MLNLVLFGPPGAGKGTQAARLKQHYNLVHLATGDLLRAEMKAGTPLGQEAKSLIEAGKLVPDEVVIGMIETRLQDHAANADGFIFDGFPRTTVQAQALDELLAKHNLAITVATFLQVPDEELVDRLLKRATQEGRADDTAEVIQSRLEEYRAKTLPVADYYRQQDKMVELDGTGPVDDVFARLTQAIEAAKGAA